jgi:hypothetical protein
MTGTGMNRASHHAGKIGVEPVAIDEFLTSNHIRGSVI